MMSASPKIIDSRNGSDRATRAQAQWAGTDATLAAIPHQADMAERQWLGTEQPGTQEAQNMAIVLRWNDEVWSQGKYDVAYELIGRNFNVHGAGGQVIEQGPSGVIEFIKVWRSAFPDGTMTVNQLFAEGDLVAVRNTWQGTHKGDFYGIPASGKQISISSIGIDRVQDGKIVEGWGELNMFQLMLDIGGIPQSGEGALGHEGKALVRRYVEGVWNLNLVDMVEELFAEDYVIHTAGQHIPTSYADLKQGVGGAHVTFPDIHMQLHHIVADGDKVTAYWTTTATHLGEFRLPDMAEGLPPTGRRVEFTEVVTFRIAEGKIAEAWYVADRLTMMGQLGLGGDSAGDVRREDLQKALFRLFAEEAWNRGNLVVVDEVFSTDYIAHSANAEHEVHGAAGHKEFIRQFRQAFPDVTLTFGDLLSENDLLVARMNWSGTHRGNYQGIPPTGKKISVDVTGINRFEGHQVVEAWGVVDMMSMMQQLGMIPGPDQDRDSRATSASSPASQTSAHHKDLMLRFIEEFWNKRNRAVATEIMARDAAYPSAPSLPAGPEGLIQIADMIFSAFPDFHIDVDLVVANDDYVIAHYTEHGTHLGAFLGVPPTGRRVSWNEMGLLRVQDGKVTESWFETDVLNLMQQLGVVFTPA